MQVAGIRRVGARVEIKFLRRLKGQAQQTHQKAVLMPNNAAAGFVNSST
jgi:hypothetical protein